jgi:hypothetical protein
MTQLIQVSDKQQEILDSVLEQAMNNVQNFEGIKSGIVRNGAKALLTSGVRKSKIAGLLIEKLAETKDLSRKTGISRRLIYHVLRAPEFKALKDQTHANSRIGRGSSNVTRCNIASSNIRTPAPTCEELLTQEVQRLKDESPELSAKEIRKRVSNLDVVKQFKAPTLRRIWPKVLPIYGHGDHETATVATTPLPGLSQTDIDKQKLEANLIGRIGNLQEVLYWMSGMEEWERRQLEKELPKGQAYSLALREKCKPHISTLIKMMPDSYLGSFLRLFDEIEHLVKVFDEELYIEKNSRQNSQGLASR